MSDSSALLPYGWSAQPVPPGTQPARVIRHDGATLSIVTADGPRVVYNSTQLDLEPTVGDGLAVDDSRVIDVLPRTSLLRRQSAKAQGAQALAANVDVVLVTCGVDRPVKAGRIYRSVAIAWDAGATPVLVLTKAAGHDPEVSRLELENPGVQVIITSALEGIGVEEVRAVISGRTAVLLGESGAGKSTLVNALLGSDAADTGSVREGDAKGRHTTTSRQLHVLPGDA